MTHLKIVDRQVGELQPSPSNPRTHSDKQIGQIATSIARFGFNNPVLIDADDHIIAGHGRFEAAKRLGLATVPALRLDHLSGAQKRAYIIADNRLAELAGWDREILAIELQNLLIDDIDFEITDIGFETGEIDLLLSDHMQPEGKPDPADIIPPLIAGPAITQPGDLWLMGPRLPTVYCFDSRWVSGYIFYRLRMLRRQYPLVAV